MNGLTRLISKAGEAWRSLVSGANAASPNTQTGATSNAAGHPGRSEYVPAEVPAVQLELRQAPSTRSAMTALLETRELGPLVKGQARAGTVRAVVIDVGALRNWISVVAQQPGVAFAVPQGTTYVGHGYTSAAGAALAGDPSWPQYGRVLQRAGGRLEAGRAVADDSVSTPARVFHLTTFHESAENIERAVKDAAAQALASGADTLVLVPFGTVSGDYDDAGASIAALLRAADVGAEGRPLDVLVALREPWDLESVLGSADFKVKPEGGLPMSAPPTT